MGLLTCEAVEATPDLELIGRFAPGHGFDDAGTLAAADVIVEFARADVVFARRWVEHRATGRTLSGFRHRFRQLRDIRAAARA
mgnify:CR=1 FL=1